MLEGGNIIDHAAGASGFPRRTWAVACRLRDRLLAGRGGFAQSVAIMLAGTTLGQAASLLLAPILTRVYAPEQFGFLSVYTAALALLSVAAALGLDQAIPIAASESELANLLALSGLALIVTTMIVAAAAWLISDAMMHELLLGTLVGENYLLPIGFACLGGYFIMVAGATRVGEFRAIASTRLSQGVFGPVSQIVLGLLGWGAPGLAIGFVIGQSSGTYLLFSRVVLRTNKLSSLVSWGGLLSAARRYAMFPLVAGWSRLLDMAGSGSVQFLLFSAFYSSEVAGYMLLTDRVIARPLFMVSTSLLQVFTGEAGIAVQRDPGRLRHRFGQVVVGQFALSAAWILLANLTANWLFPIVFGQQWLPAVTYLHAMSLGYLALAVLHPVSTSPWILERQVLAVAWQAARLIAVVGVVAIAWQRNCTAMTALWLASAAQAVACLGMLLLIAYSIQRIQPSE